MKNGRASHRKTRKAVILKNGRAVLLKNGRAVLLKNRRAVLLKNGRAARLYFALLAKPRLGKGEDTFNHKQSNNLYPKDNSP